jgi:hypothetical protein
MLSRLRRCAPPLIATVLVLLTGLTGAAVAGVGPVSSFTQQIQQFFDSHKLNGGEIKNGSLKGTDVKNGSLAGRDVKDGSLTGQDVRDGSLAGRDMKSGSLPGTVLTPGTVGTKQLDPRALRSLKGAPGAQGAAGPQGIQGTPGTPGQPGSAAAVEARTQQIESIHLDNTAFVPVATLPLTPGAWTVVAALIMGGSSTSGGDHFLCELREGDGTVRGSTDAITPSPASPGPSAPTVPLTVAGAVTAVAGGGLPDVACKMITSGDAQTSGGTVVSQRVTTLTRDPIRPTATPTPTPTP